MSQHLRIVRGTSNAFGISVTDEKGNPYTLTEDQVLIFGLKCDEYSDERVLVKKITNAVDGEYYLELTPKDTADLEPGRYFCDVGMQQGDGVFYNVIECRPFFIAPNVTQLGDGA